MDFSIIKTDSSNSDFVALVALLNAELAIRDGEEDHAFYDQFNKITSVKHCAVLYSDEVAVGCGALKAFDDNTAEVKRMFVKLEQRGKGLAVTILTELETWAKELGFGKCILETGFKQPEAIALYKKCGYQVIENYGQYAGVSTSICFEKVL
ncbi:MAG: putative acetyltransferase [Marinoscillum sp.]|jgi:putative acetyltransferase